MKHGGETCRIRVGPRHEEDVAELGRPYNPRLVLSRRWCRYLVAIGFALLALGWLYYAIENIRSARPDASWRLTTLADIWYLAGPIAFALTAAGWWWLIKTIEGLGQSRAATIGFLLLSAQGVALGIGGLGGAWVAYGNPTLDYLLRASWVEVVGGAMVAFGYLNLAVGRAKGGSSGLPSGERESEGHPGTLALRRLSARGLWLTGAGLGTVTVGVLLMDLVDWTTHSSPSSGREALWAIGFVLVGAGAFCTLVGVIRGLRPRGREVRT